MTVAGWLVLLSHILLLSLLSVGGAITVAPDLHRLVVGQLGLLSDAQFNASIAIAQSAPGPNALYVAAVGYQAGGVICALAVLVAILLPSSLLTVMLGRWGQARQETRLLKAFKAGMAPVSIALLGSTSWLLVADSPGWRTIALAGTAAVLVWRTRLHILCMIAAGALLGGLGWI